MAIVQLIGSHVQRLHEALEIATTELTPGQLHWRPPPGGNHLAFTLWHYVRTEDNIVRYLPQDGKPTVWLEGGWNERFGLDPALQGSGMTVEEAAAISIPSIEEFRPYIRAVWKSTDEYLTSITDADLERVFTFIPVGERSAIQVLMENV